MKVAILIPGQARFFKNNNDILNLKNKYNADIFIHTWQRLNEDELYSSPYCEIMKPFKMSNNDINEYIEMYSPKNYIIEKELTDEYIDKFLIPRTISERTSSTITKYNLYRYLYSLNSCAKMLDNSYDNVIITRSDMINIRLPHLEKNSFYTPVIHCDMRNGVDGPRHCGIDSMLFSIPMNYLIMYCNLIYKMDLYYDKGYHYNWEEMFFAHLYESGLINMIEQKNTDELYFEIKRDDEGIIKHKLW